MTVTFSAQSLHPVDSFSHQLDLIDSYVSIYLSFFQYFVILKIVLSLLYY